MAPPLLENKANVSWPHGWRDKVTYSSNIRAPGLKVMNRHSTRSWVIPPYFVVLHFKVYSVISGQCRINFRADMTGADFYFLWLFVLEALTSGISINWQETGKLQSSKTLLPNSHFPSISTALHSCGTAGGHPPLCGLVTVRKSNKDAKRASFLLVFEENLGPSMFLRWYFNKVEVLVYVSVVIWDLEVQWI